MTQLMRVVAVLGMLGGLGFGSASVVRAHEGHTHTVMGVVWKVTPEQVEVRTKDGKTATILITDRTAISRGKTLAHLSDVVPGVRVVVEVGTGSKPLTATRITLGVAAPSAKVPSARSRS